MIISIGELQKNISLLKKAKEDIIVIDKRTGKKIARIEPIREDNDLELFNEIVKDLKPAGKVATKKDIENAYIEHLREKYDFDRH
jgi:hypothetical protein